MWVRAQDGYEVVNISNCNFIFIDDLFNITAVYGSIEDESTFFILGIYEPVGRVDQVRCELYAWIAAGGCGMFDMPER